MINFAVIGTNFITDQFMEASSLCADLNCAAVYSRREETATSYAAKYNIKKTFTDLTALAEDTEIDAVYIASPNSLHCAHSILMLSHKKHVLCEKPIASNTQELEKMLAAAKQNDVILIEAMRSAFDPGFQKIQELLPRLGKIRRADFRYCQYSSRYDKFKNGIIENAFRPELSNGALMDIGVYCVHPMMKLFGTPNEIQAQALILKDSIDAQGTIAMKWDDMIGEAIYSKISEGALPSEIQAEQCTMTISTIPDPKTICLHWKDGKTETITIEKHENNMVYEAEVWAQLILEKRDAKCYHDASLMSLKVMDEARRQTNIVFPADC